MGLISNLWNAAKGQMANVVEWKEMDDEDIFSKWPNAEIKKGSKLIIRPGQDAIFFFQGRVEGIFTEEGEYDIESQIIPFLSTLKGFKYGFDSALRAEVLFVNTREFIIPWGTKNAINLPVPGLPGGMPIRAFGQAICKVGDYNLLIEKVAGVSSGYQVEDIRPRISAVNDQLLMKWIVREGKDMFNLQANAYDIGKGIAEDLTNELQKFGMKCEDYQIQSVSYPDNVREMQEKAAGQAMIGDLNKYTTIAVADGIANGDGIASTAAGAGIGWNIGQQIANNLGGTQPQAAPQTYPTAAPAAPAYAPSAPEAPAAPAAPEAPAAPQCCCHETAPAAPEAPQAPAEPTEKKVPNFCPNCGTKTNGMNFCGNCGYKLI